MSTELDDMTPQERKDHPIFTGVLKYFPNALLEVAHVSKVGNEQHNPGEPLHWAMEKSTDEGDALVRHQLKAGTRDKDGERHSAKVAWRALAQLEREILTERIQQQGQEASWRYGIGEQKDQRTYPGDGHALSNNMMRAKDDLKSEFTSDRQMGCGNCYPRDAIDAG